jgi:hypothetical protein
VRAASVVCIPENIILLSDGVLIPVVMMFAPFTVLAKPVVFTELMAFAKLTVLTKFMVVTIIGISVIRRSIVVIRVFIITITGRIRCATCQHQPDE